MSNKPEITEMLKAGLHFGHRTSKWHPKMEQYIFTSRNGIHIIDLVQTATMLEKALNVVESTIAEGGNVLFLGSKPQIKDLIKASALEANVPYITERWLGGTITNFPIISLGIKKYSKLKAEREKGDWDKYAKKERLGLDKTLERMERKYGGLESLTKVPDVVVIIDAKTEQTALAEAKVVNVPVIALCDTNVNPEGIDYVIPGNDNSIKGVAFIMEMMVKAVKSGRAKKDSRKQEEVKKEVK